MPQEGNTVCENQLMKKCSVLLPSLNHCGTSEVSTDKLLCCIGTIENANRWESFVETLGGINAGHRANANIGVQSTSTCRRTDGVTRGSKRLASGRPALRTNRASK